MGSQSAQIYYDLAEIKQRFWFQEHKTLRMTTREIVASADKASTLPLPAIQEGDIKVVDELLELGADPLHPLADGKTVLHTVARYGLMSMMKLLTRSIDAQPLPKDLLRVAVRRERPNITIVRF